MQQLYHRLKDGKMEVSEVPFPLCGKKQVLVRNHCSVISPGTEGRSATDARKGYIAKARSRKEELDKVIRLARQQGLKATYDMVMRRLESPAPLGYSSAGEVIAVGEEVKAFRPGDRVACGGGTANHAEVVAVPEMLCVKIPENVQYEDAAFTTLGAIAMQGVRQAEVQSGGTVAVIGLGLIGMLSVQILKASGINAIAVDLKKSLVDKASGLGAKLALMREAEGLEESVLDHTNGLGADAVLVCASTDSTDPVDLAGKLAGQKGRVVIVGNVPTGFSRKEYYRKELDLRMSMSYGPGRYDPQYEEHGHDYPPGHVRWTENRNMQAFLGMLADGSFQPSALLSHRFPLEQAPEAFDLMLEKETESLAILLRYNTEKEPGKKVENTAMKSPGNVINLGVIGAGSYANNVMLPLLKDQGALRGISSARGLSAKAAIEKYGFSFASGDIEDVVGDAEIQAIFVFTRHDTHAPLAIKALEKGKHVFVEKPTALTLDELYDLAGKLQEHNESILLTGFNRRFAPAVKAIEKHLPHALPRAIHMRVNAGKLPKEHWVNDEQIGGGRIIGEVCHFIDLAAHFAQGKPLDISTAGLRSEAQNEDTLGLVMRFDDGSIASISYFSNGNPSVPKEEIEVFSGGVVAQIHDWKSWSVKGKKTYSGKQGKADKGHEAIIEAFIHAIKEGKPSPIPFESQYSSMMMSFAARKSLRESRVVSLQEMINEAGKS